MKVPNQNLPEWGGALGKLVRAIHAVVGAVDKSGPADAGVQVVHGGNGELRIGLAGGSSHGGGISSISNSFRVENGHILLDTKITLDDGTEIDAPQQSIPIAICVAYNSGGN